MEQTHAMQRKRNSALGSRRAAVLLCLMAFVVACVVAACGGDESNSLVSSAAPLAVIVDDQVQLSEPCTGASLTFFEGTMPVNVEYQIPKKIEVAQLFGAYQIGFQVNGWYWRSCVAPGNCPNPKNCQNPDNAGQVGIEVAPDCSTATLLQNWDVFTCDSSVPNASGAVTVALVSSNPCTVMVASTAETLQPTDGCCSCNTCTGSQVPPGQVPHCQ